MGGVYNAVPCSSTRHDSDDIVAFRQSPTPVLSLFACNFLIYGHIGKGLCHETRFRISKTKVKGIVRKQSTESMKLD